MIDASCCCVVEKIGFTQSGWSGLMTCHGGDMLFNLAGNVTRLAECKVVFEGLDNVCGRAINFASGDWPAVKTYIQGGGRLWINAEYGAPCGGCLAESANMHAFLAAMGSTLSRTDSCDNPELGQCVALVPGAANIAAGASLKKATSTNIFGGTSVWLSASGNGVVNVEQLGDGFIFLSGDSNLQNVCGQAAFCDFFKRVWEYDDGDII